MLGPLAVAVDSGWMIAVGVLSLSALLLDLRFAAGVDGDPALD